MQENLTQTDTRFCPNTTTYQWVFSDTITNSNILPYAPLPIYLILFYLSTVHRVSSDTLYIYLHFFISSLFPQNRYKAHEGRNFGMCYKRGKMEGGPRACHTLKRKSNSLFLWSKI